MKVHRTPLGRKVIGAAIREDALLVELKAVDRLHPLHDTQVLTYLKLSGLDQGLLINFNVSVLRHGLKSFLRPGFLRE